MEKPNIIFFFSDQQRADTMGVYGQELDISPNLDRLAGGGFKGGKVVEEVVSTASIPKTILAMAGVDVGEAMIGENLETLIDKEIDKDKVVYAQISESRLGRCIRSKDYLYSVYAPESNGWDEDRSNVYEEEFFYDLRNDPYELNNLVNDKSTIGIRQELGNYSAL